MMDSLISEIDIFSLIHPTCLFTTSHQLQQRKLLASQPTHSSLLFLDLDVTHDQLPDENDIDQEILFSLKNYNNFKLINQNNNNNNTTCKYQSQSPSPSSQQQDSITTDKKRKRNNYDNENTNNNDEKSEQKAPELYNRNINNTNNTNEEDKYEKESEDEEGDENDSEVDDIFFHPIKIHRKDYIHVPSIKIVHNNNNNNNSNNTNSQQQQSKKILKKSGIQLETMQKNVFQCLIRPPMEGLIG